MRWYARLTIGIAVCSTLIPPILAQEPPTKPKVELRWVETNRIEGLTEDNGFQSSCDPNSIVYPHKRPALVLTAAEVSNARLTELDLTKNGLGVLYEVKIDLTKEAREKLAASVEGNETRALTVAIDGRYWGVRRYEKDNSNKSVSDQSSAETFCPNVGFFSSMAEAQRLVEAFR